MAVVVGGVTPNSAFSITPSTGFVSGQQIPIGFPNSLSLQMANGTTADKVDLIYATTLTFTASTPQSIDLKSLTDPLGSAVNFVKIRLLEIRVNSTTDAATLTLSPNASNGWTSFIASSSSLVLRGVTTTNPYALSLYAAAPNTTGWTVGASNKVLDLTPSAHAFTVDIQIVGCSA